MSETTSTRTAAPGAGRATIAPFIVCVVILGGAASLLSAAKAGGWLQIIKLKAPLRKPIDQLSQSGPYRMTLLPKLSEEVELELGTRDYGLWECEDEREQPRSPERHVSLFVTFYTGKPDQLPHVPDECYQQGGRDARSSDDIALTLDSGDKLSVRRLLFGERQNTRGTVVYYTLSVNGDCYADRMLVRTRMADPRERHLYYSKVEISFVVPDVSKWDAPAFDRAAARMLNWLIPLLQREHWPDMAELERRTTSK